MSVFISRGMFSKRNSFLKPRSKGVACVLHSYCSKVRPGAIPGGGTHSSRAALCNKSGGITHRMQKPG